MVLGDVFAKWVLHLAECPMCVITFNMSYRGGLLIVRVKMDLRVNSVSWNVCSVSVGPLPSQDVVQALVEGKLSSRNMEEVVPKRSILLHIVDHLL